MATFNLKNAESVRQSITQTQQKQIKQMYEQLLQEVSRKVGRMGNNNPSKMNLVLLQRDIKNRIEQINKDIQNSVVNYMRTVSNEVVTDTKIFLKQCGFKDNEIHNAFMFVPDEIVKSIITGNVYEGDWSLSKAIWGYGKKTQDTLNGIISMGTAQGKSAYEIAKDLESYVNPSARKKWDIRKIYPDWKKYNPNVSTKIDYNAMRLARTMVSHAYQQSFERVNENCPFVEDYIWHSAGIHGRTCELCLERDGQHFKKNELPLDHPNGMCTFEAYIPDSMSDIAEKIGKWYQSPTGTYPDIDSYALDFM